MLTFSLHKHANTSFRVFCKFSNPLQLKMANVISANSTPFLQSFRPITPLHYDWKRCRESRMVRGNFGIYPALTFGGDMIPVQNNHTHLGITFSKGLRFHQHNNQICRKVNTTLSQLYPIANTYQGPYSTISTKYTS